MVDLHEPPICVNSDGLFKFDQVSHGKEVECEFFLSVNATKEMTDKGVSGIQS